MFLKKQTKINKHQNVFEMGNQPFPQFCIKFKLKKKKKNLGENHALFTDLLLFGS